MLRPFLWRPVFSHPVCFHLRHPRLDRGSISSPHRKPDGQEMDSRFRGRDEGSVWPSPILQIHTVHTQTRFIFMRVRMARLKAASFAYSELTVAGFKLCRTAGNGVRLTSFSLDGRRICSLGDEGA